MAFRGTDPSDATFYMYLARFSPEEIRAAYRSPSGAPLQMAE